MKNVKKNNKGFTIIEVVLVLAIAGLIFLIVFLALPRLQRSRRDTQRKNDGGNLVAQLENYGSAHNGSLTGLTAANLNGTVAGQFKFDYMTANGGQFNDPQSGTVYTLALGTTTPAATGTFNISLGTGGTKCDGSTVTTARDIVVRARLESGEYCQSNS